MFTYDSDLTTTVEYSYFDFNDSDKQHTEKLYSLSYYSTYSTVPAYS